MPAIIFQYLVVTFALNGKRQKIKKKKLHPLGSSILAYFSKVGRMTLEMANLLDIQFQVIGVYRKELKEHNLGG